MQLRAAAPQDQLEDRDIDDLMKFIDSRGPGRGAPPPPWMVGGRVGIRRATSSSALERRPNDTRAALVSAAPDNHPSGLGGILRTRQGAAGKLCREVPRHSVACTLRVVFSVRCGIAAALGENQSGACTGSGSLFTLSRAFDSQTPPYTPPPQHTGIITQRFRDMTCVIHSTVCLGKDEHIGRRC